MANEIQVYGTDWCGLTHAVREYLTNSRLAYDYVDIDRDADAHRFVLAMNDGRLRFPLVVVEHHVVPQPTVAALQRVLGDHGIHPFVSTIAYPRTRL
jgi:glutaredoxin